MKREFYPMLTQTIKTSLSVIEDCDLQGCIKIITDYPEYHLDENNKSLPIIKIIIRELDRQYARWTGGIK